MTKYKKEKTIPENTMASFLSLIIINYDKKNFSFIKISSVIKLTNGTTEAILSISIIPEKIVSINKRKN